MIKKKQSDNVISDRLKVLFDFAPYWHFSDISMSKQLKPHLCDWTCYFWHHFVQLKSRTVYDKPSKTFCINAIAERKQTYHKFGVLCSAGLAECLRDAVKVNTLSSMVKSYTRPGWLYNADRQCHYIFGEGYGLCPYMVSVLWTLLCVECCFWKQFKLAFYSSKKRGHSKD